MGSCFWRGIVRTNMFHILICFCQINGGLLYLFDFIWSTNMVVESSFLVMIILFIAMLCFFRLTFLNGETWTPTLIVPAIILWQIFLTCTKHAAVSKVNWQFLSLWLALLTKISKLYNLVWYWSPLKIYDLCYARFKSYLIFLFPLTFDFCNVWLIEVFHIC